MTLADAHSIGSLVTLVAIAVVGLAAAVIAFLGRFTEWIRRLRIALLAVFAAQVLLGAANWLSGARPAQGLHILYGGALLVLLPLADSFVQEATPRERAAVTAIAALVGLALIWRLTVTG